jgi:hypothetical protein
MTNNQVHLQSGHGQFRIESDCGLQAQHWSAEDAKVILVHDRSLAVAMAAKSLSSGCKGEVRVVYMPTGEVIFRKRN